MPPGNSTRLTFHFPLRVPCSQSLLPVNSHCSGEEMLYRSRSSSRHSNACMHKHKRYFYLENDRAFLAKFSEQGCNQQSSVAKRRLFLEQQLWRWGSSHRLLVFIIINMNVSCMDRSGLTLSFTVFPDVCKIGLIKQNHS